MLCEKLTFKIIFVTYVQRLILNFISTKLKHKNIYKQKDGDAFDIQNIKSVGQFFIFGQLNFTAFIVIYLSFIIIYGYLLKYTAVTVQLLQ